MTGKLGKLPARHDRRTLRLSRYVDRSLPPPLQERIWGSRVERWGEFRNREIGCCTISSLAHAIQCWTSEAQHAVVTLRDEDVLAAYGAIGGWPARDEGAYLLDALNHARQVGIGGHKIVAYAAVNPRDEWMVPRAIDWFGGVYCGFGLPLAAQLQGDLWTVEDPRMRGTSVPWSWGGHAVFVRGYEAKWLHAVTWGRAQRLSAPWVFAYCDEMYAVLTEDWIDAATQRAPVGLDLATLLSDLHAVTR
jgi:hypothetical protein